MVQDDVYKTISQYTHGGVFKDKNSKFFGYAFPLEKESEIKVKLELLKKEHPKANHFCYAFQIGSEILAYNMNDDGEPKNSAGAPIYGQIQSFGITNILIVVVRYFGGTKLGVSGLINAYKSAAQQTLSKCHIIEKTIDVYYRLNFEYKDMSSVMALLKKFEVKIINQELEAHCMLEISVRKGNRNEIYERFENFYGVKITEF